MVVATKQKTDPRCQPGAVCKIPSGARVFVTGMKGDRVLVDHEARHLGSDSFPLSMLTLVQESLEPVPAPDESFHDAYIREGQELAGWKVGDRVIHPKTKGHIYTIQEIDGDQCCGTFKDSQGYQRQNWLPISELESAPSLITTAQTLWAEIDQAVAVADQANYSALDSARLCGETLLQLKAETPHGQWETVRNQIVHPRTGKPMPSQTATLYQRISEKWEILKAENVRGIKQADEALRRLKPAKEQPETKSPTVGEIAQNPYEYVGIDPKPVWILDGDTWIESKAVAQNGRGFVQVLWGNDQEASFPPTKILWSNPDVPHPSGDERDSGFSGRDLDPIEAIAQNEDRDIQFFSTNKAPTNYPESNSTGKRGVDLPSSGRHLPSSNLEAGDLSTGQKTLLNRLKEIASIKSAEIFTALKGEAEPDDLVAIADELETAILEILESRFL